MKKRPNPAVDASERRARSAEDLASLAETTMSKKTTIPGSVKNLAERRRTAADKIKRERPYLREE